MLRVYGKRLGDSLTVCLQGQLVSAGTAALREVVFKNVNAVSVVLDFARVSRIDAGGLGVLLELRQHTLARGKRFSLINVTKLVQQVLEITSLDSVFDIRLSGVPPASTFGSESGAFRATCP